MDYNIYTLLYNCIYKIVNNYVYIQLFCIIEKCIDDEFNLFLRTLYARRWFTNPSRTCNTAKSQIGWKFPIASDTSSLWALSLSKSHDIRRCRSLSPTYWSWRISHRTLSKSSTSRAKRGSRRTSRFPRRFG